MPNNWPFQKVPNVDVSNVHTAKDDAWKLNVSKATGAIYVPEVLGYINNPNWVAGELATDTHEPCGYWLKTGGGGDVPMNYSFKLFAVPAAASTNVYSITETPFALVDIGDIVGSLTNFFNCVIDPVTRYLYTSSNAGSITADVWVYNIDTGATVGSYTKPNPYFWPQALALQGEYLYALLMKDYSIPGTPHMYLNKINKTTLVESAILELEGAAFSYNAHFAVVSADGLYLFISLTDTTYTYGLVHKVSLSSFTVVGTVQIATSYYFGGCVQIGDFIYVGCEAGVKEINIASFAVTRTFASGQIFGIDRDVAGDYLYAYGYDVTGNDNTLFKISVSSGLVIYSVVVTWQVMPGDVKVTNDYAYFTGYYSSSGQPLANYPIYRIDLATFAVVENISSAYPLGWQLGVIKTVVS